jgi:hypothetical protein
MMLLIHLSHQAQGAIASGMFTLFVFSVQTALLYSRFETRRKGELQHKEMEVKATYEKEVVKYNQHAKVAARVHVIGIEGNNSFKLGCRELGLVPFQKFRSFACVGFDVLLAVRSRL